MYCIGDFQYYFRGIFGRIFTNVLNTCLICFCDRFVQTTSY